jgi:hypothetical protein
MAYRPNLRAGARNLAVRAMQNGLHRALHAKGLPHKNNRQGGYGVKTIEDVNRFKHAYGIRPVIGLTFGQEAWAKLEPFLGRYDRILLARMYARQRAKAIARKKAEESSLGRKIEDAAGRFYLERWRFQYSWLRPYLLRPFSRPRGYYDCSSSSTVIYHEAGAPDPNGFGYNGYGFTGTIWPRGKFTTDNPQPGDLAFYGYDSRSINRGGPSHMAVVISAQKASALLGYTVSGTHVVSFGSNPVRVLPLRYRSDFRGTKSYLPES